MVRYLNTQVVFREVPDEIALAINITNCPNRCPGCHTPILQCDVGIELTIEELDNIIENEGNGCTCICFMGGDSDTDGIARLAKHVNESYGGLFSTAWYSGLTEIPAHILENVKYIKTGGYVEELGPLDSETTNQKMFVNDFNGKLTEITYKFKKATL